MKNIISIAKNPRYAEAAAVLSRLVQSHSQAQAEADRTGALLAAWNPPKGADAVSAALDMLDSNSPARSGMSAIATANVEARNKVDILWQAIQQQHTKMSELTSELSAEESALSRADHAEAVRGISKALKTLGDALQAETDLRARIDVAGYRCTLPSFQFHEIGVMTDPDSLIAANYRAALAYAVDHDDSVSGQMDKTATVHLLSDWPGAGRATEVVSLAGRLARHLVRLGKAEATTDKPRRVAKQRAYEAVLE
jgi:hypothetical protein